MKSLSLALPGKRFGCISDCSALVALTFVTLRERPSVGKPFAGGQLIFKFRKQPAGRVSGPQRKNPRTNSPCSTFQKHAQRPDWMFQARELMGKASRSLRAARVIIKKGPPQFCAGYCFWPLQSPFDDTEARSNYFSLRCQMSGLAPELA